MEKEFASPEAKEAEEMWLSFVLRGKDGTIRMETNLSNPEARSRGSPRHSAHETHAYVYVHTRTEDVLCLAEPSSCTGHLSFHLPPPAMLLSVFEKDLPG